MTRGVRFTEAQKGVLSQIMKDAWARKRGQSPPGRRMRFNPGMVEWEVAKRWWNHLTYVERDAFLIKKANAGGHYISRTFSRLPIWVQMFIQRFLSEREIP